MVANKASRRLGISWHLGVLSLAVACLAVTASADDDLAARRARIASLSPGEQQELLRKQERFNALPPEEQERLRRFQATLDAEEHPDRLQRTLERYHEWLKTLTPSQRAQLSELEPKQRVEEIKRIQKRQREAQERSQRFEVLTRQDMREILDWTEQFVWERKKKLVADLPKDLRQRYDKMDQQRQRRLLLLRAYERSRHEGGALESIEQEDIDRLRKKLSEPAQKTLAEANGLPSERRLVGAWIGISMHRLDPWSTPRRQSSLVVEDLLQYLQNEVPPPERQRLLKMPREQMLEELRAMYFERGRGEGGPGRLWFDGKPPADRGKGHRGPRPALPGEAAPPPASETPSSEPQPETAAEKPPAPTETAPPSTPPAPTPPADAKPAGGK